MTDALLDPFIVSLPDNPSPDEARQFVHRLATWVKNARETGLQLVTLDKYENQIRVDGRFPNRFNLEGLLASQNPQILNSSTIMTLIDQIDRNDIENRLNIKEVLLDANSTVLPETILDRLSITMGDLFKESLASCALHTELSSCHFPDFVITDDSPTGTISGEFKVQAADFTDLSNIDFPLSINTKWTVLSDETTLEDILANMQGECTSLIDAVDRAKQEFGDCLVFLDRALDSARDYGYQQPQKAYDALKTLGEVGRLYHHQELSTSIPQAFERRLRGGTFARDVSQAAQNQHPTEYLINYKRSRQVLGPHIRLGRGNATNLLRIYFYIDKDEHKFVVGHVGRHLRD